MGHLVLISLHADPATPSGAGEGGGTHAYVRELIMGLLQSQWRLTVITRWADTGLPQRERLTDDSLIVRLQIGPVVPIDKRLLNDLHSVTVYQALKVLNGERIDVIHSIYWNSGRLAQELAKNIHRPFVHTVISNGWRRWQEGARDQPPARIDVERLVFASAFGIFCVSYEERRDLIEHYAVSPNKVFVVGRPVAQTFRTPCRDEYGRPLQIGI